MTRKIIRIRIIRIIIRTIPAKTIDSRFSIWSLIIIRKQAKAIDSRFSIWSLITAKTIGGPRWAS